MNAERAPSHITAQDLTGPLRTVLSILFRASEYARKLGVDDWDYAEEIVSLRAAGASNADLRWLMQHGVILHGRETVIAAPRKQPTLAGRLALCEDSCFILSDRGKLLGRQVASFPVKEQTKVVRTSSQSTRIKPRWLADVRQLYLGKEIVKRFRRPAENQTIVLDAFQEDRWPPRIDDPLPQKHDTINSLNRHQVQGLIHFFGDGTGEGIGWQRSSPSRPTMKMMADGDCQAEQPFPQSHRNLHGKPG